MKNHVLYDENYLIIQDYLDNCNIFHFMLNEQSLLNLMRKIKRKFNYTSPLGDELSIELSHYT